MEIFDIITTVIGISGGLGLAYSYFQKSKAEGLIALQAQELQTLQDQNARLKEENSGLMAENTTLKKSNVDLKSLAQQTPQIRTLTNKIAELTVLVANIANVLSIKVDGIKDEK